MQNVKVHDTALQNWVRKLYLILNLLYRDKMVDVLNYFACTGLFSLALQDTIMVCLTFDIVVHPEAFLE